MQLFPTINRLVAAIFGAFLMHQLAVLVLFSAN